MRTFERLEGNLTFDALEEVFKRLGNAPDVYGVKVSPADYTSVTRQLSQAVNRAHSHWVNDPTISGFEVHQDFALEPGEYKWLRRSDA